eukprot:m51a1_g11993 putative calcium calmodulin-dependent protein kinase type 1 (1303) ;mRNA; r:903830-910222
MAMNGLVAHNLETLVPHDLLDDPRNYYTFTDRVIGGGREARVMEAISKQTGERVAVKMLDKRSTRRITTSEAEILRVVRHPNIITLYDVFDTQHEVYLVMELAEGGELFQKLCARGSYCERDASHYMKQILEALAYLHSYNICHRDLKPENLLLDKTEKIIKLSDFGMSRILSPDYLLTTPCGTPGYIAPEVINMDLHGEGYTEKSDLWSAGVILYIMLSATPPFWDDHMPSLFSKISKCEYSFPAEPWNMISKEAKDLIQHLLCVDYHKRYSAAQALQHPWITSPERDVHLSFFSKASKGIKAAAWAPLSKGNAYRSGGAAVNWGDSSRLEAIREQLREIDAPAPVMAPMVPCAPAAAAFPQAPACAVPLQPLQPMQPLQPAQVPFDLACRPAAAVAAPKAAGDVVALPPPPSASRSRPGRPGISVSAPDSQARVALAGVASDASATIEKELGRLKKSNNDSLRTRSRATQAYIEAAFAASAQQPEWNSIPLDSPPTSAAPALAPVPAPAPAQAAVPATAAAPVAPAAVATAKAPASAGPAKSAAGTTTLRIAASQAAIASAGPAAEKKQPSPRTGVVAAGVTALSQAQSGARHAPVGGVLAPGMEPVTLGATYSSPLRKSQLQFLEMMNTAAAHAPAPTDVTCIVCGFSFSSELMLRSHMESQHRSQAAGAAAQGAAAGGAHGKGTTTKAFFHRPTTQAHYKAHAPIVSSATPPPPSVDFFAPVGAPAGTALQPTIASMSGSTEDLPSMQSAQQAEANRKDKLRRRSMSIGSLVDQSGAATASASASIEPSASASLSSTVEDHSAAAAKTAPAHESPAVREIKKPMRILSASAAKTRKERSVLNAVTGSLPGPLNSRSRGSSMSRDAEAAKEAAVSGRASLDSRAAKEIAKQHRTSATPPPLIDFADVQSKPATPLAAPKLLKPRKTRTREEKIVKAQAVVRGWQVRRWFKPEAHRSKVAHELESSEATYLKSLVDLVDVFVTPLRKALEKGKPLISAEDIGELFSQFERVYQFNLGFYKRLKRRVKKWTIGSTIGSVFSKLDREGMLEIYSEYTVSYNNVLERFLSLRRSNSAFDKFVDTCEKHFWNKAGTGNSFQAFLILPIQRLPRYVLLLKEIIKWTDEAHPDYPELVSASEFMEDLCWQVNERQRLEDLEKQRVSALFALGSKIEPKLTDLTGSPERYCTNIEGPALLLELGGSSDARERYFFLLSDLLIVTRQGSKGRFHLKLVVEIASTRFRDVPGTQVINKKEMAHVVELHTTDASYAMIFGSEDDKSKVLIAVSKLQVALQKQQPAAAARK